MNKSKKDIKKTIREVYGSISRGEKQLCCDTGESEPVSINLGYNEDQLNDVPAGADLGLGCGNPVGLASLRKDEIVLDLGSGGGFDCFIAARAVGEKGYVIGVDMTPEMIERAKQNARNANISNVEFRLGENENLPVEDNSVDVVISNCVVNLSPDKQAVYDEIFRVLKPGGRLAIADILSRIPLPEEIKQNEKLVAGCIGGAVSMPEIYQIIEKAGFTEISIQSKSNSSEIISAWKPGDTIEDYIFSAYISAMKPATTSKERQVDSKSYFERVANDWDEMRTHFFPDSVREAAYKAANIQPGKTAADIGAGTGFVTEGLLQRGVHVIAVDQSPAMLERMEKKFGSEATAKYLIGESSNLPIADQSVDAVFANMYLHHVESPPDAIREMARILKPGGVLVITDLDKHNHEFLVTEQYDRWMGFERPDVTMWFEEAGLGMVTIDCVGDNCCAASNTSDDEAQISIFIATGKKTL